MQDLRDFLNWFDGFAENIGKAPNATQWAKLTERLLALKATVDAQPIGRAAVALAPAQIVQGAPDPNIGGTKTTQVWRDQVFKALTSDDIGFDEDSAREVMNGKTFVVDLNMEPMAAALLAAGKMN